MATFIPKETALKVVEKYGTTNGFALGRHTGLSICIASEIAEIPAADVMPVVRCKDCKHKGWVQEPCHGKSVDYCKIWDCTLRNLETTFCSHGERRDKP